MELQKLMEEFNVEALTTDKIIKAVADQYGEGNFEEGLRKICKLSDEGKEMFGLKLEKNSIAFDFKEVEDLVQEYAIKHSHAWTDAIKRTCSVIKIR